MEEILKSRIIENKNRLIKVKFANIEDIVDTDIKSKAYRKMMIIALDIPQMDCWSQRFTERNRIATCAIKLNESIYFDIYKETDDIEITVYNANKDIYEPDLIKLGYKPTDFFERLGPKADIKDYSKFVKSADIEKELLNYINVLEKNIDDSIKNLRKDIKQSRGEIKNKENIKLMAEILKEYLKEDVER